MRKLTMIAAILGTAGTLALTAPPASAADTFRFSFSVGDVAVAYRDGYYDRYNRWHRWSNPREAREFRLRYSGRYRDIDRDGVPNRYDRDRDGDGIRNRFDRRPNDPRWARYSARYDRDRDGVPDRYDAYPRNPRRY